MKKDHDVIVIGGGHNGLACGCYLARSGLSVLVLEQYDTVGGMTATEEIILPGFKSDLHASGYQLANLSPTAAELELHKHGFELIKPDPSYAVAFPDGDVAFVARDRHRTMACIESYSKKDAQAWNTLYERYLSEKDQIIASLLSPPKPHTEPFDAFRFDTQTLRSWCDELFESEKTKCLFGSFSAFLGLAPDDVGSAKVAWFFSCIMQDGGNNMVRGGMNNLSLAMASYLKSKSGEIRTRSKVEKIILNGKRATGVRLDTGEILTASKAVISGVDPQQLVLKLLGENELDDTIINEMKNYELGDSVFMIYTALNHPIQYKSGPEADRAAHVLIPPPSIDGLAKVALDTRSNILPKEPLIVIWNDSAVDPSRAPPGKHLIRINVFSVPYKIKGSNWDDVKDHYADQIIALLTDHYIPNLKESILKRVVHSPLDIEKRVSTAIHGTICHGAVLPYQTGAMRPIPPLSGYKTPITNVYLCGAGTHPGPGISMASGRNAAQIVCQDLKLKFYSPE